MMKFLKYIGDAGTRILSKLDLANLGADAAEVLSKFEGDAIAFTKNVAVEINTHVAEFIANHEELAHEFHLLSDDEAAAEAAKNNPPVPDDMPAYMKGTDASSSSSTDSPSTATPSSDEPASASSTDPSAPAGTDPSSLGSSPEATT